MYLPSLAGNVDASFDGKYGNPTVKFDSSIGANPNKLITLTSADATGIDDRYFSKSTVKRQEIVLTRDITGSTCSSLKEPGNPIDPVFARFNNLYWIHDPRYVSQYLAKSAW